MASNSILNRVQIIFYSILITIMSGVNRIRSYPDTPTIAAPPLVVMENKNTSNPSDEDPELTIFDYFKYTQQAFNAIFVWIILGFATGFLAGLINFR